jgi:hypothetical protein
MKTPINWKRRVETTPLAVAVLNHWMEHRPKMCKELEESGDLHRLAYRAAVRTAKLQEDLWKQGLPEDQGREIANREWFRLPDEEDVPDLALNL